MKSIVTGVVAAELAVGMGGLAWAQGEGAKPDAPAGDGPRRPGFMQDMSFENMDANKDGKVSLEEYQKVMAEMSKRRFEAMDADKDGVVTKEEMQKGREGMLRGPRGPRPEGGDRKPEAAPAK